MHAYCTIRNALVLGIRECIEVEAFETIATPTEQEMITLVTASRAASICAQQCNVRLCVTRDVISPKQDVNEPQIVHMERHPLFHTLYMRVACREMNFEVSWNASTDYQNPEVALAMFMTVESTFGALPAVLGIDVRSNDLKELAAKIVKEDEKDE